MSSSAPFDSFNWEPQPLGQKLVSELLLDFLHRCPGAENLARHMKNDSGTRFADWVDSIEEPETPSLRDRLRDAGFTREPMPGAPECFVHKGAIFPAIILATGSTQAANGQAGASGPARVSLKVDSVADFLATWKLDRPIEGEPLTQFRRARCFTGDGAELWCVERHGYRGFAPVPADPARCLASVRHLEAFRRRNRDYGIGPESDRRGFAHALALIDGAIDDLGTDWACDLFFQAERDYWQRRNRAARVQKARQDALGLGWANHDHHTYRSSRSFYPQLIAALEKLGFHGRERFYAGAEAGWGAQVLEQPVTGITIFADVDMSPEELAGDFPHEGFTDDRDEVGTIGLWCDLHGEAFLQAGMHHLECQFDWHALKDQLALEAQIRTMDPFTTFPYLRQAFTQGERWPVDPRRIELSLARGHITPAQAENFRAFGAVGSHLENLERNDGFKGFNQTGVSQIIAKTDPRKLAAAGA